MSTQRHVAGQLLTKVRKWVWTGSGFTIEKVALSYRKMPDMWRATLTGGRRLPIKPTLEAATRAAIAALSADEGKKNR